MKDLANLNGKRQEREHKELVEKATKTAEEVYDTFVEKGLQVKEATLAANLLNQIIQKNASKHIQDIYLNHL